MSASEITTNMDKTHSSTWGTSRSVSSGYSLQEIQENEVTAIKVSKKLPVNFIWKQHLIKLISKLLTDIPG